MKFSSLAAAMLMAISSAAFADVSLGTLGSTPTVFSGSATGWFDFNLSSAGSFSGQLSGTNLLAVSILDSNYGVVKQTYFSNPSSASFSSSLAAGSYEMLVYLNPGQASFTGSVGAIAAPVPEASNNAMLALGIAAVAWVGLRLRQTQAGLRRSA